MMQVKKAVLGAVLLAGTALALAVPAQAQVVQFQGYVGTGPNYGPDPNYAAEQPYSDQGYEDQYGDAYGYDNGYGDPYGYDSGAYNYDYADPFYFTASTYSPVYDPFYDPYCDYYTPPWGFPLDYCRYQTWNQPIYYGGLWYSGPIYYRAISGVNWYWLNGSWCRDQWSGARPAYIDW